MTINRIENILVMAFHYALTDKGDAPFEFADYFMPYIPQMKINTLSMMYSEIQSYLDNDTEFTTIRGLWESMQDELAKELSSRGCCYNALGRKWAGVN